MVWSYFNGFLVHLVVQADLLSPVFCKLQLWIHPSGILVFCLIILLLISKNMHLHLKGSEHLADLTQLACNNRCNKRKFPPGLTYSRFDLLSIFKPLRGDKLLLLQLVDKLSDLCICVHQELEVVIQGPNISIKVEPLLWVCFVNWGSNDVYRSQSNLQLNA